MRPLETILAAALALVAISILVPYLRRHLWAPILQSAPVLALGLQAIVEGPRWQMAPMYAVAAGSGQVLEEFEALQGVVLSSGEL